MSITPPNANETEVNMFPGGENMGSPVSLNEWMDDQNQHQQQQQQHHERQGSIIQDNVVLVKKEFVANSHELASALPEVKGAIQSHPSGDDKVGVRDIGWHKPTREIPDPLIGTMPNGKLFSMIRRFNKDVFAVRAVPKSTGLDLNNAWSDEYQTDKLTLNLQRFYLSIGLGISSFLKQVARLRSWEETRRTSAFFVVYFVAWASDLLVPVCLATIILVISSPDCRNILFPPAPRSLVSLKTGRLQKPQAGQLGTVETLTGAPEKEIGEAVEEEAAGFVDNIRHVVQRIVGMHDNPENDDDPLEGKVPQPVRKAIRSVKAKGSGEGHTQNHDEEQTEQPMEELIWEKTKPAVLAPVVKAVPHVLGEVVDTWERIANAISPTPPFSRFSFLRLSLPLVPLFVASFFVSSYMVYKTCGFALGLLIFGNPVLSPALGLLNSKVPNWTILAQLKNNILLGVPTNIQLTITLLRIGEVNNTPIPPVPSSSSASKNQDLPIAPSNVPLAGTTSEKLDAIQPSRSESTSSTSGSTENENEDESSKSKSKKPLSKIASLFKSHTKATVHSKLAFDQVRAGLGSEKAKGHVGVLPKKEELIFSGPEKFKGRYEGKEGWLFLAQDSTRLSSRHLVFRRGQLEETEGGDVKIDLQDVQELKRATAFSGKTAETMGGWASGAGRELLGSLEVVDVREKVWRFTGLVERDELFNRMIAQRGMMWENL